MKNQKGINGSELIFLSITLFAMVSLITYNVFCYGCFNVIASNF